MNSLLLNSSTIIGVIVAWRIVTLHSKPKLNKVAVCNSPPQRDPTYAKTVNLSYPNLVNGNWFMRAVCALLSIPILPYIYLLCCVANNSSDIHSAYTLSNSTKDLLIMLKKSLILSMLSSSTLTN
jgi:hypothetical protein